MTPSGGGLPVSRTLLDLSQSDLEAAWKEREDEAIQLMAQGSNSIFQAAKAKLI